MGEIFSANVQDIEKWRSLMKSIAEITDNTVRDFEASARTTLDWPGRDDSLAKDLRPRDKKERDGTTETGASLMLAISGISKALQVNADVIQRAQNDNNEAINDASRKTGKH
ncbi:hypothetical protein [Streptomyces violaceorubidus]|uniref:hypothetical protein n=1 Tax=Streptomyces violaceorubidus TaxID=284042 RepID=UPI0004C18CEC|nr:hypothetical protein [Streptomyces violaceorubidus]